jgi:hypothetical protein
LFVELLFTDVPKFNLRGRVKTVEDKTRFVMKGTAEGTHGRMSFDGKRSDEFTRDVRFTLRARINSTGMVIGTLRVEVGVIDRFPITLDLAPQAGNDGSWLLTMRLRSPNRNKLKGRGVIEFANGQTLDLVVAEGRYDRERDRSRVVLEVDGQSGPDAPRVRLGGIRADADTRTIERAKVKYRLFGQEGLARIGPNICN